MRTTATLLLLIAIGCGGARENSRTPTDTTTPAASTAESPTTPADEPVAAAAPAEPSAAPEATVSPAAATTPATAVAKAEVKLLSGDGSTLGTMTFERKDKMVAISGQFSGLKKGQNAIYIHTKGDCSDKGRKIGGHLNPTGSKHGPPASPTRHAGDFGDLTFDKAGNATFAMETDSITLEPGGPDSVVGRAVVVHSRKDNKKGSAGSPIACGVVVLEGAPDQSRSSYTNPAATPEPTAAR